MPDRRPIRVRHAPSETEMPVETHWRPTYMRSPIGIQTRIYLNILIIIIIIIYFLLIHIIHVGIRWNC